MSTQKHKHHTDEKAAQEAVQSSQVVPLAEQDAEGVTRESDAAAQGPTGIATEIAGLKVDLLAAREEVSSLNDKYLRKLADEANFRKRMMREKDDAQKFALAGFIGDVIPSLDDFDRAIGSAEQTRNFSDLHDGVLLIRRQLGKMLENKYGLKRMESVGQPFDPNSHEAVAMEMGETQEPVVGEEFLPGYMVGDRIIRTAKVKVRMPLPPQAPAPASGAPSTASDPSPDSDVESN